jgi:hypothetical protein
MKKNKKQQKRIYLHNQKKKKAEHTSCQRKQKSYADVFADGLPNDQCDKTPEVPKLQPKKSQRTPVVGNSFLFQLLNKLLNHLNVLCNLKNDILD